MNSLGEMLISNPLKPQDLPSGRREYYWNHLFWENTILVGKIPSSKEQKWLLCLQNKPLVSTISRSTPTRASSNLAYNLVSVILIYNYHLSLKLAFICLRPLSLLRLYYPYHHWHPSQETWAQEQYS